MALLQIDGSTFKNLVLAGAYSVINKQDYLNKINVFPVPDGDTGSNMAAAFESIAQDLETLTEELTITETAGKIADAALNGSRGNSGAILAQFFQGLYHGLGQHQKVGLEKFAEAMEIASKSAHDAISNPVEGTIITVMHDWAEWVANNWDNVSNFTDLLNQSLSAAQSSLDHTPDQLAVLSENHVVDAGAQGFFYFIQGAAEYLQTGTLPKLEFTKQTEEDSTQNFSFAEMSQQDNEHIHLTAHAAHGNDLNYQYCTECIIHGDNLDLAKVKQKLSNWGNSFVIVGSRNKIKVHIHTNAPDKVFRDANLFGELLETKADDMWAQYRANINFSLNKRIALITDSSCNLPQELIVKYNIITLPLQMIINNQVFLDKVNLSPADFVKKLTNSKNQITTSQPTLNDIKTGFNKALSQSSSVIGAFISDKLSGTYRNICQVAKQYEEEEIYLYDSRNTTGGLGLIILEAAKAIHAGKPLSTIKKNMLDNIAYTVTFVAMETIKYAVRGGRVSKTSGFIANLLHLLPILKLDSSGKATKFGIGFGKYLTRNKMLKTVVKYAKSFKDQELIITHVDCLEAAKSAQKFLQKRFPKKDIYIVETTPILATHAGPGALAVSVLGKMA